MHLKHTCPNTNTSLAQAHLGWSSKLEDGEKDGEVVPEQNLWLRYDVFLLLQKFKGTKGQTRNNDCKSFSSNRTKQLTKQAPEDVASDADGVEALPRPRAGLLHCLHWRHEHNVKSSGVLATESEAIFEILINTDHCVLFIKTCLGGDCWTCCASPGPRSKLPWSGTGARCLPPDVKNV